MASKKALELDERVKEIIDKEFADYERYLPTIQDIAQYQRKRKEYWSKVTERLNEEGNNGRADAPAATSNV